MIPKSGNRFSVKIMLNRKKVTESDSTTLNQTLLNLTFKEPGPVSIPSKPGGLWHSLANRESLAPALTLRCDLFDGLAPAVLRPTAWPYNPPERDSRRLTENYGTRARSGEPD